MTEAGLTRLRGLLGWLAMALCLGAGLSLADSFLDSIRTGPDTYAVVAGDSESLTAPLPPDVSDAAAMRVTIDHPGLRLQTTTQTQGFWLGNRMWQATVTAAPDAAPGTARVILAHPDPGQTQAKPQIFTLLLFPDKAARDAASHSRIRQWFGVPSLLAAAVCGLAAVLLGCGNYFTSKRLESRWARQGKAVIYAAKNSPEGLIIAFGLGANHGLAPGAAVRVIDAAGRELARATVAQCTKADASALVRDKGSVRPGQFVTLVPPASVTDVASDKLA